MKYAQTSLFGAEKMTKMQRLHGIGQSGKTCKTCKHLVVNRPSNRNYYKCELFLSNSAATDIRVSDAACGMYEEELE